jgi:hypothetical protein
VAAVAPPWTKTAPSELVDEHLIRQQVLVVDRGLSGWKEGVDLISSVAANIRSVQSTWQRRGSVD